MLAGLCLLVFLRCDPSDVSLWKSTHRDDEHLPSCIQLHGHGFHIIKELQCFFSGPATSSHWAILSVIYTGCSQFWLIMTDPCPPCFYMIFHQATSTDCSIVGDKINFNVLLFCIAHQLQGLTEMCYSATVTTNHRIIHHSHQVPGLLPTVCLLASANASIVGDDLRL